MEIKYLLFYSLLLTLLITLTGFRKTVWFISIGYTFSIVVSCVFIILSFRNIPVLNLLQQLILIAWGIRLGYYIISRERNSSYAKKVKDQTDKSQNLNFASKAGIWISVSLLYVCMLSPAIFAMQPADSNHNLNNIIFMTGIVIMTGGFVIESLADRQKTVFKNNNPGSFCNTGLYQWVRYPNYLGEILVWLGNFICALLFLAAWWQWAMALTGLVCIILIMMGSAKRLEKKQSENYGKDPEFSKYEKRIPILFPWIPVFTLQNIKVYLE